MGWCVLYVYCSVHCTLSVMLHVATDVSVTVASNILVNMELKTIIVTFCNALLSC